MAIIAQSELFGWDQIDALGDLERLRLVIEHLPDEELKSSRSKNSFCTRLWKLSASAFALGHAGGLK